MLFHLFFIVDIMPSFLIFISLLLNDFTTLLIILPLRHSYLFLLLIIVLCGLIIHFTLFLFLSINLYYTNSTCIMNS